MTTWVIYLNTKEPVSNDTYRILPDTQKEWSAQIQVYTNRIPSKKPLYNIQFDDNPKAYFLLPRATPVAPSNHTPEGGPPPPPSNPPRTTGTADRSESQYRTLEADRETEIIFREKIQLYKTYQTVTIKGDESWWGDYCIRQGIINAGALGQKGVIMEVLHPPTMPKLTNAPPGGTTSGGQAHATMGQAQGGHPALAGQGVQGQIQGQGHVLGLGLGHVQGPSQAQGHEQGPEQDQDLDQEHGKTHLPQIQGPQPPIQGHLPGQPHPPPHLQGQILGQLHPPPHLQGQVLSQLQFHTPGNQSQAQGGQAPSHIQVGHGMQDVAFLHLCKFLQTVRNDGGQGIRQTQSHGGRSQFDTSNNVLRATYYLKILASQECFLKPENE